MKLSYYVMFNSQCRHKYFFTRNKTLKINSIGEREDKMTRVIRKVIRVIRTDNKTGEKTVLNVYSESFN